MNSKNTSDKNQAKVLNKADVSGSLPTKNLTEKAKEFVEWLNKLRQVAADKLNIEPSEVKINDEEAFKYYNDGFTPTQCFRETW